MRGRLTLDDEAKTALEPLGVRICFHHLEPDRYAQRGRVVQGPSQDHRADAPSLMRRSDPDERDEQVLVPRTTSQLPTMTPSSTKTRCPTFRCQASRKSRSWTAS